MVSPGGEPTEDDEKENNEQKESHELGIAPGPRAWKMERLRAYQYVRGPTVDPSSTRNRRSEIVRRNASTLFQRPVEARGVEVAEEEAARSSSFSCVAQQIRSRRVRRPRIGRSALSWFQSGATRAASLGVFPLPALPAARDVRFLCVVQRFERHEAPLSRSVTQWTKRQSEGSRCAAIGGGPREAVCRAAVWRRAGRRELPHARGPGSESELYGAGGRSEGLYAA